MRGTICNVKVLIIFPYIRLKSSHVKYWRNEFVSFERPVLNSNIHLSVVWCTFDLHIFHCQN